MMIACGGGQSSANTDQDRSAVPLEPTRRDSAGMPIYEHPADALQRAPLIVMDTAPMAVLTQSGDDDFARITMATFLSDDRIAFADGAENTVRIHAADGAALRRIGRKGEGPGEFSGIYGLISFADDSIAVTSMGQQRITVIHPDSGVVRVFGATLRGTGVGYGLAGSLADGSWLLVPTMSALGAADAATDGVRPSLPIVIVREDGSNMAPQDTVTMTLGTPMVTRELRVGGEVVQARGQPLWAPMAVSAAWDGELANTANEEWRIDRYAADGEWRGRILVDVAKVATTDAMFNSNREASVRRWEALPENQRGGRSREDFVASLDNQPRSESIPPIGRMYVGSDQVLWVQDYPIIRGEGSPWFTALDTSGRILGRLEIPAEAKVLAFGKDRVLLSRSDADGVAEVTVHRISPSR
jgi:hypothetical protein